MPSHHRTKKKDTIAPSHTNLCNITRTNDTNRTIAQKPSHRRTKKRDSSHRNGCPSKGHMDRPWACHWPSTRPTWDRSSLSPREPGMAQPFVRPIYVPFQLRAELISHNAAGASARTSPSRCILRSAATGCSPKPSAAALDETYSSDCPNA